MLLLSTVYLYFSVLTFIVFLRRYRGTYLGQDVAIKVLRSEHLNDALEVEFAQEVAILR